MHHIIICWEMPNDAINGMTLIYLISFIRWYLFHFLELFPKPVLYHKILYVPNDVVNYIMFYLSYCIGAQIKWPSFYRRYVQIHFFLYENCCILIQISLNFVHKGSVNNQSALVQIMTLCHGGDNPLSEPVTAWLTAHVCITRPRCT